MTLNGFPSRTRNGHEAKNTARATRWVLVAVLATLAVAPLMAQDWPLFRQNVANTAANTTPGNSMSPKQITKLTPKWIFTTGGDVSARASVVNGAVYFPDWGGNL